MDIRSISIAYEIERYIGHGERQIEQILRKVLNGEKIPHGEKVLSIFKEHKEWISKGEGRSITGVRIECLCGRGSV
jgi:IS5 family transposase